MESIKKYRYINFLWACMVFLMCSLPVTFQILKVVLLVLLFFVSLITRRESALKIDRKLGTIFILWIIYALYTSILGFVKDNPGAFAFFKVNVLYYLLLFLIVIVANNKYIFRSTVKAIYFSNYFISAYTFYLLLYSLGIRLSSTLIVLDDTAAVGLHVGYTHITNTNLSMTIFTFPFLCLMFKYITESGMIKTKWLIANLVFTAAAMFMSGRRILWLVFAISIVLFLYKGGFSFAKKVKYSFLTIIIGIIGLLVLSQFYEISFVGYLDRFFEVFSKVNEYGGDNVRYVQMSQLVKGFWEQPIFGSGGGAVLRNYSRTTETPWIFECTYHVILFNAGIIGTAFFIGSIITVLFEIKKTRSQYRNGVLYAFVLSLFANATNPYMTASFDFWIFMFIPLMYLAYSRELSQNIISK